MARYNESSPSSNRSQAHCASRTPLKSRTTRPLRRSTSNTLPLLSATAHKVQVGAIETFKACRRLSSKHVLLMCKVPRLPWLRSTTPSGISLGSTGLNHRQAALMRDDEGGLAINSATVGAEPTPTSVSASTGARAEGGWRNAKWSAAGAPANFSRVRRLPLRYHASCVAPGATRAAPASSLILSVYAHASPCLMRTRPSFV